MAEPVVPLDQLQRITGGAIDRCLLSEGHGEIKGLEWWQLANALTAITLHDQWSGTKKYGSVVESILEQANGKREGYINEFNDDSLWWALACLAAYSTYAPKSKYLKRAHNIQRHVASTLVRPGQLNVCGMDMGGACYWKPGDQDLNSITTGLFVEVSAQLVNLDPELIQCGDEQPGGCFGLDFLIQLRQFIAPRPQERKRQYLSQAKSSVGWIERCRMNPEGYIFDTIKIREQSKVDWCFTYLQGQTVAGIVALIAQSEPNERGRLYDLAIKVAEAVMAHPSWCEPDGTLTEKNAYGHGSHDGWQNNDAVGFKSIYVRSLAKLYGCLEKAQDEKYSPFRSKIKDFVNKQFNSLQTRDVDGSAYGPWWAGPFECATSHSQMAALDVMAAVHRVNRS